MTFKTHVELHAMLFCNPRLADRPAQDVHARTKKCQITNLSRCLRWTFVLVLFAGLSSCSTAHKRAEKLFESGAYDEAIKVYEQILKEDPADADAEVGLRNSRSKLIEKRLIEIRMSRLAENFDSALNMLEELLRNEKAWTLFPSGAVAFTQSEESNFLKRALEGRVKESLKQKFPVKARVLSNQYSRIYELIESDRRSVIEKEQAALMEKQCTTQDATASAKVPFYADFTARLCQRYSLNAPKSKIASEKIPDALFGKVQIVSSVTGLTSAASVRLEQNLNQRFMTSPWFHGSSSRVLTAKVEGSVDYSRSESREQLVHEYKVDEPYTDYEDVTRYRDVSVMVPHVGPNGTTAYQSETRQESYVERVPVTRYRSVPKMYHFWGRRVTGEGKVALQTHILVGADDVSSAFTRDYKNSDQSHDSSLPEIGLHPKQTGIPDKDTWWEQQSGAVATELILELSRLWVGKNCEAVGKSGTVSLDGDQAIRCLRQQHSVTPAFAESWFQTNYGVSAREMSSVVEIIK